VVAQPAAAGLLAALTAVFAAITLARHRRSVRAAKYYRAHRARARMQAPNLLPTQTDPSELVSLPASAKRDRRADVIAESAGPRAARRPAIGYVSVPPEPNGHDTTLSERAIERVCARDGWDLIDVVRDENSGSLVEGSEMSRALERIANGEARALLVSDARLLGRDVDLADVMHRLDAADAALVAIDLGLDTSTPHGRRVAGALITMNGWGHRERHAATPAIERPTPIGNARC
jgi:hypothetical protein